MKTQQAIRSRLKALEGGLDFALKQREANHLREQINLLTWVLKD